MTVKSTWPDLEELKKIVNVSNEFFELFEHDDIISPYVLKHNYTQEGVLKHFDRGLVSHSEHHEYSSHVYMEQME